MTTLGGAASALLSSYWQPLSRSFSLRLLVSCNDCPLLRPPAGKEDTFDGTPSNSSAAASMRGCEIVRLRCFGGTVASSEEALVRRRLPLRKEPRCISLSIITASTTMYLLRIKGCGLASMLFFLGLSLLLTIQDAEAGMLMSKGIGRMRGGGNRYKPWDTTGRLTQGGLSVENGEEDSPQSYYNYPPEPARRRPCVGLCYYEKLLALQGRKDAEREQNETTQEKRAGEEPCVGICQYYRSLGIENPYDRNIKRNF